MLSKSKDEKRSRNQGRCKLFVVFFIIILLFPLCSGILGFHTNSVLYNVETYEKPAFSVQTFFDGSFQSAFEAYWNSNFPNHHFLTKVYNQIRYSIFGEGATPYIRGKDNWIHDTNYIEEELCLNPNRKASSEQYRRYAETYLRVYEKAKLLGKEMCLVVTPNKTTIASDSIPYYLSQMRPAYSVRNETLFREVMEQYGIDYCDARRIATTIGHEYPLFLKDSVHWTEDYSSVVFEDVWKRLSESNVLSLPQISINPDGYTITDRDYLQDSDIWTLLNIWTGKNKQYHYPTLIVSDNDKKPISVFAQGGSFTFQLLDFLSGYNMVDKIDFVFYEQTIYRWELGYKNILSATGNTSYISNFYEDSIKNSIANSNIILLECNEAALSSIANEALGTRGQLCLLNIIEDTLDDLIADNTYNTEILPVRQGEMTNFYLSYDNYLTMGRTRGYMSLPGIEGTSIDLLIPWNQYCDYFDSFDLPIIVYADGIVLRTFFAPSEMQTEMYHINIPDSSQELKIYCPYFYRVDEGYIPWSCYSLSMKVRND